MNDLRLLAARAGGTPVFGYSRSVLRQQVDLVRAASTPGASIYYSLKANPHPGVVNTLSELVDGFDVCSMTELEVALQSGMEAGRVLYTGPAKSRIELASALSAGVLVTVESPGQASLVADVATELGVPGCVVIRLNVLYPARNANERPQSNHFGVAHDQIPAVLQSLRHSTLRAVGVQVFWGSQYFEIATITRARASALDRAKECAALIGEPLDIVSIGGGIATQLRDSDPDVDWSGLSAAATSQDSHDGWCQELAYEYGRAIVGPAGVLITTVLDTKIIDERRYVAVDAGMNHLLLGSRLMSGDGRGEFSVRPLVEGRLAARTPSTVTGPLCSQLDVFADNIMLPEVEPGDLLIIDNVGAYGRSFSPDGFLSRTSSKELIY